MALQTQNLVMVGLGIKDDAPPNSLQAALVDGIHLRWAFKRELGFPWYGYHLFRRQHLEGEFLCLSNEMASLKNDDQLGNKWDNQYGQVCSDENLFLTDDFAASPSTETDSVEFDLVDRHYLRFSLNPGEPARKVEVWIGFRTHGEIEVTALSGNVPVAWGLLSGEAGEISTVALEFDLITAVQVGVGPAALIDLCFVPVSQDAKTGWEEVSGFSYPLRLPVTHPDYPCTSDTREDLSQARDLAKSRIMDGNDPDQFIPSPAPIYTQGTVTVVNGSPIVIGEGTHWDLPNAVLQIRGDLTAYTILEFLAGDKLILSRPYAGVSGTGKSYVIQDDPFGQFHDGLIHLVAGGNASGAMADRTIPIPLTTVGATTVTNGSTNVEGSGTNWGPELSGLAIQFAAYAAGSITLRNGSSIVTGSGTSWGAHLRGMTLRIAGEEGVYKIVAVNSRTRLTLDRPYAGMTQSGKAYTILERTIYPIVSVGSSTQLILGRPYVGDSGSGKSYLISASLQTHEVEKTSPRMPLQHPLDLILLASLNPAIAQTVGLYWVDQEVDPDIAYDYLILADHTGHFSEYSHDNLSNLFEEVGFGDVDAYIVFNKQIAPETPLPAPDGLRVYALPGFHDFSNNAGLCWNLGVTDKAGLLPGKPILYHIWRADLGNGATPAASDDYQPITHQPILVTVPRVIPGKTPQCAADWPPFPLHYIDSRLREGWYGYQVSGVDIFGRHSPNSSAGLWYQWTPAPEPRPWYYKEPPEDTWIHHFAVRLLDKMPPPPPTGIEAYVLDPADPTVLKDVAYDEWREANPEQVGLRMRWLWTEAHMRQAPDTREFRIYYNLGTDLPEPNYGQATVWQERYYVVGYNEHVTPTRDGEGKPLRKYEIFLPAPDDLIPSLAEPIIYAYIGVSAADNKTHTQDTRATGGWGGRFGNEGRVGGSAKVFRVRREPPPTPLVPSSDSDKVLATPADYHSHSYYTYRWLPQPHLKAHICRALDDSLFRADWKRRQTSSANISVDDQSYFPAEWCGSESSQIAKRDQIANELNHLNNFSHDAEGSNSAEAYYRGLSNDALRVLAGLPGNESAFTQLTIKPLDPQEPDPDNPGLLRWRNHVGPDNPPDFPVDPTLRAYTDTVDGRSTNRYFYRAAYVDGAHNRSGLSLSSPPVYLPNVVPPRAPVITEFIGGDRQITLKWASNREPDLAEYRVYRADNESGVRDVRLMTLVHTEGVASGDPVDRPAEVTWTDQPIPGLVNFYYRVVAVDEAGNMSMPSSVVQARAYDDLRPAPPVWNAAVADALTSAVTLSWTASDAYVRCLLQRRHIEETTWSNASGWLPRGTYTYTDMERAPGQQYIYRLRVMDTFGRLNRDFNEFTI